MDFSMFEAVTHTSDMANMQSRPVHHTENNRRVQYETSTGRFPERTPLAMAYVPCQQWGETYSVEKGLERGTVFPELDLPFAPEEGCL